MVTESMAGLMTKKMDYQLKWILDNQNEYSKDLVLAAREELAKRERPVKSQFTLLLIRLSICGNFNGINKSYQL